MCHHELWPISVSHPFCSLNSSLGFAAGKHYQKITIPIFRLVLQNFAIPGCFSYILSVVIFSPYFLLVGLLLRLWLYFCQGTGYIFRIIVNWCRVAISNDKSTQWVPSLFCVSFLIYFYTPRFNEVERGVYWFHLVRLSVCPSVRLWTESCPLCIFNNTCRIHFIFAHLIKQLQKDCRVYSWFQNS